MHGKPINIGYYKMAEIIIFQKLHMEGLFNIAFSSIHVIHLNISLNHNLFHRCLFKKIKGIHLRSALLEEKPGNQHDVVLVCAEAH